jgi:3-oxoadipate enol-lactonase
MSGEQPLGPAAPAEPPGGRPPCLVFLPTVGQLPTDWQDQVTAVPADWRCWVPWLRGLKPTDAGTFELDAAVADLVRFLEQHGVRRTHLVGLGLGALVALRAAAHHPDLVDRLVLVNGQVAPPRGVLRAQRTALRLTPRAALRRQHVDKDRALAALDALRDLDLHADLARVRAPTLVLSGASDRAAVPASRLLADGIAGAVRHELPGGERLNQDTPAEFNELVLGFLTGPVAADPAG